MNCYGTRDSESKSTSETGTFSWRCRTSLREALEIRIADFKGCVLLQLLLCLNSHHHLQVLAAAARGDPQISFANPFRGPLKKCTNRRPFKLAMQHKFLTFPRGDLPILDSAPSPSCSRACPGLATCCSGAVDTALVWMDAIREISPAMTRVNVSSTNLNSPSRLAGADGRVSG
jgi:hypothetical protein